MSVSTTSQLSMRMKMPERQPKGAGSKSWLALNVFCLVSLSLSVAGCTGCGEKSKKKNSGGGGGTETVTEVATTPVTDTTTATETDAEVIETVGETLPPIDDQSVVTIDTKNAAALKHLIFETSDSQAGGRFLTEFLLVIRAKEDSCVRLKVRPTSGLTDRVQDTAFDVDNLGAGVCGEKEEAADEATDTDTGTGTSTSTDTETDAAELRSLSSTSWEGIRDPKASTRRARGFSLAEASAALCSSRLFRMEAAQPYSEQGEALEPVSSKTGRLVFVGSKVRLWLDEEFANVCPTGTTAADPFSHLDNDADMLVSFGPLKQMYGSDLLFGADRLFGAQVRNLSDEMDKIIAAFEATYGALSDVDSNGFVEVFISPDVNRKYFIHLEKKLTDDFRPTLVYRPNDLAYYDAKNNPTSNEGEVLYLWTPDPGGIYSYVEFPSSNSIDSNFAKGYLASQVMTLAIANQRLLIQSQPNIPDPWLLQSLSLLSSAYYGGNDYSWVYTAEYMTSRSQYISLVNGPNTSMQSEEYGFGFDEAMGMRALFGWYLHAAQCGETTVAPCAALKSILTSAKNGRDAVEEILGKTWDETLENFALSVGIALLDHPENGYSYWAGGQEAGLPPVPAKLPDFNEIFPSDPRRTAEEWLSGSGLHPDENDASQAAAFPSKKMLMFQPITSDNDMEFKIAADAVTFILVTSLIDRSTDVTAWFGKGLNAVFIPTGERDMTMRQIHVEKISEQAHHDLQPQNLTDATDPETTLRAEPYYEDLDFSVNKNRELWVLGSIDNFQVNANNSLKDISDSDAYAVNIAPCSGLTGSELTDCQGQVHEFIAQVYIRDFAKEVAPMLIVGDKDRSIYRGHSIVGRLKDLYKDWKDTPPNVAALCQSAGGVPSFELALTEGSATISRSDSQPHGLNSGDKLALGSIDGRLPTDIFPLYQYTVVRDSTTDFHLIYQGSSLVFNDVDTSADAQVWAYIGNVDSCANGGFAGHTVFDHTLTRLDPEAFAHNYDNFLMAGYRGFPYTTYLTQTYRDAPTRSTYRSYRSIESARQYYNFALNPTLKPTIWSYYPIPAGVPFLKDATYLTSIETAKLAAIKREMDAVVCNAKADADPFIEECKAMAALTADVCRQVCLSANVDTINAKVALWKLEKTARLLCYDGMNCPDASELMSYGLRSTPFFNQDEFYFFRTGRSGLNSSRTTYYTPIEPVAWTGYCAGDPGFGTNALGECSVHEDRLPSMADIRQQFNVLASEVDFKGEQDCGFGGAPGTKVCIDPLSWRSFADSDKIGPFVWLGYFLPTDRHDRLTTDMAEFYATDLAREYLRPMNISFRAGEVIGKPQRVQYVTFNVSGTGDAVNLIVGGRKSSQGKYLLRVRQLDRWPYK